MASLPVRLLMALGSGLMALIVADTLDSTLSESKTCHVNKWSGVKVECQYCKALVENMENDGPYEGKCSRYCAAQGLSCVEQQEDENGDCEAEWTGSCNTSGKQNQESSSDLICQCAPHSATVSTTSPSPSPSPAIRRPTTIPYATCKDFQCPIGMQLQPGGEAFTCSSQVCDIGDKNTCCMVTATCASYTCPSGMQLRSHPDHTACHSREVCDATDRDRCCRPASITTTPETLLTCVGYACPAGMTLRPNVERITGEPTQFGVSIDPKVCCAVLTTTPIPTSTTTPPPDTRTTASPINTTQFFDQFTKKEKIIGGAMLGGSALVGGAVGALTGSLLRANALKCQTALKSDVFPGSSVLEVADNNCFRVGDNITVGRYSRKVVGFGSILIDRPIPSFLKKGIAVRKSEPLYYTAPITARPLPDHTLPAQIPALRNNGIVDAAAASQAQKMAALVPTNLSNASNLTQLPPEGSMPGSSGGSTTAICLVAALVCVALCCATIALFMSRSMRQGSKGKGRPAQSKLWQMSDSRKVQRQSDSDHLIVGSDANEAQEAVAMSQSEDEAAMPDSYDISSYYGSYEADMTSNYYAQGPQYAQSSWNPGAWSPAPQNMAYQPEAQPMISIGQNVNGAPALSYMDPRAQAPQPMYGQPPQW